MKIFISYRRADSEETTGRVYDKLVAEFGRDAVFRDIDTIPLTTRFADHLLEWLSDATVVVAVIGPDWLLASDANGNRRIEKQDDFVRIELLTALRIGIPIIPIIVRRAKFPPREELPVDLQALTDWNGQPVRPDPDFHTDMSRLIAQIASASNQDTVRSEAGNHNPGLGTRNREAVESLESLFYSAAYCADRLVKGDESNQAELVARFKSASMEMRKIATVLIEVNGPESPFSKAVVLFYETFRAKESLTACKARMVALKEELM